MLRDLVKDNQSPKNDIEKKISCNRLRSVSPFIVSLENYKLISHTQLSELVDVTFQRETRTSFQLKETSINDYIILHSDALANEVDEIFENDFGKQKINLLNSFTDRKIEVLRQIKPTTTSDRVSGSGAGNGGSGRSKVTDQREKFSCPLCSTKHQSNNKPVRPFLFVCQVHFSFPKGI